MASIELNAGDIKADIAKLSDQLIGKIAAVEGACREAESKNNYVLTVLEGQLHAFNADRDASDPTTAEQIIEVSVRLEGSLAAAKDIAAISAKQNKLLDKIEEVAKAHGKSEKSRKGDVERIIKELDENKTDLQALSSKVSAAEVSIKGAVIQHSQNMADHAYPTIFNLVSRQNTGRSTLQSALHRSSYVYCCCEFQCANAPSSKDIPAPLWHPVPTDKPENPYFRCIVWQTKDLVEHAGAVLKLSYMALKIAASIYETPIPSLAALNPEELSSITGAEVAALAASFSSLAGDFDIDVATLFEDDIGDQFIAELKDTGVSPALMRPSTLSSAALQVLQSLFPMAVCVLLFLLFLL
jgi:hypothetical protein